MSGTFLGCTRETTNNVQDEDEGDETTHVG